MGTTNLLEVKHVPYPDDIDSDDVSIDTFSQHTSIEICTQQRSIVQTELIEKQTAKLHELEEKLHRSQKMLQLLMDNIPQKVFWKDCEFNYLGCNQAFAEHAGLNDPRDIIGKDDYQMPWKAVAEEYRASDMNVIAENSPLLGYEDPQEHPDRGFLWLVKNKLPLCDLNGNVIGLLEIIQDVTEVNNIKESLIKNENILAEAQSISHIGSWEYCLETDREYRSLEFFRILGIPAKKADFAQDSMFNYIHPMDKELVKAKITETLEHGKPYDVEYRIIRTDEAERTVHARGKIFYDEYDRTTKFIGTIQDITEWKQTEEALLFTQFSVDHAAIPICWISEDGRFSYCNHSCGYLGYSREQLADMSIFDIEPSLTSDKWKQDWQRCKGKEVVIIESVHRTRKGEFIQVLITAKHIENKGREYVVAFVRDISQQKLAEKKADIQLRRLASQRTIDTAITGSLDLKVVLTIILDQSIHQLGADAADILLLNNAYWLEPAVDLGFRTNATMKKSITLGSGIAGRAALEHRIVHIPDVRDTDVDPDDAQFPAEEEFITYFCVPLVAKGKLVGVMEIYYRSPQLLGSDELNFLETLGKQTAIAVDDATMFSGLQKSNLELIMAYDSTLEGWSRALDLRDKETEGHSRRVTELTVRLAMALGIRDADLIHAWRGAMLHDIGKMGIPDSILLKPGPLDELERAIMEKHPVYAFKLLSPIEFLQQALNIPYCHHEKWDGSGYPRKLSGEQIPFAARIFAIVDVWDALCSDRPYRPAWPREKSINYILQQAGKQFDPQVVEVFMEIVSV
ncbi:MAG: PAS domain S-box protein [Desulfuromonadales bacterium]|nr:PAS domain S-box protein [Desulfuromonadales bacterium]